MKNEYEEKINNINDGTKSKLLNVLEKKKISARDADTFRIKIAEAEAKVAEQTSISEEQRVILANKSQVIIGLQYQISQVKSELSESKKNAQRLSIQVKTLNELLENVRKISDESSNAILGGEQDMQLTLEEAQTIITTLGMRVLQLEQSLGHAKQKASEVTSQAEDVNAWPEGFRHFERFSYMPKLIAGMGESLTACAQLSDTLYLMREAPNWAIDSAQSVDGEQENSETAVTINEHLIAESNEEKNSSAPQFSWNRDWGGHLTELSRRIDEMTEIFREALTSFRAEIIQRQNY